MVRAPIDRPIIPVVEAVNRIPHIFTTESCQGEAADPEGEKAACIFFSYFPPDEKYEWKAATIYLFEKVGFPLYEETNGCIFTSVSVHANHHVTGEMSVYPGFLEKAPDIINNLANKLLRE